MDRAIKVYCLLCLTLVLASNMPVSDAAYRKAGISVSASDTSNSTTSPVDATGISFEALANSTYEVEINGAVAAAASSTGFQPSLTGPSGASIQGIWGYGADTSNDRLIFSIVSIGTVAAYGGSRTAAGGLGQTPLEWHGLVTIGGTPGTVKMQFQSETGGSNVTLKAGSFIRWRRLNA